MSSPRGIGSSAGGGRHRAQHLHFKAKPKRRAPKWLVIPIMTVIVIAAALLIRAATESAPAITLTATLPAQVTLTGQAPSPQWPPTGESAVEIQGLPTLGTHGPQTAIPIAALTKVMTAYVVLADHPLQPNQPGFTVTVTAAQVTDYQQRLAQAEAVVPVTQGEQLTELQLLQALLIPSGNNIAEILAAQDAGGDSRFVSKMNQTAQHLGMIHTTYTDPSGLNTTTVSDAADQLKLADAAMANPVFAQIVAMPSVNLPVAGQVSNFNPAVGENGFVGIKTGSESASGGCLMFANRHTVAGHTVTVIGAVLGQDPGAQSTGDQIQAAVTASTTLVDSVANAVAMRTVLPRGTVVATATDAQGHHADIATTQDLTEFGYAGASVPLSISTSTPGSTVRPGQQMATVTAAGTQVAATATAALAGQGFVWKLEHPF